MAAIGYGRPRRNCIFPELDDYIERKGCTLEEFSEKIGINRSTLSNILSGKCMPGREAMEKISSVTGLTGIVTADGIDFVDLNKTTKKVQSAEPVVEEKIVEKVVEKIVEKPIDISFVKKTSALTADLIMKEIQKNLPAATSGDYTFKKYQEFSRKLDSASREYAYLSLNSAVGYVNDILRDESTGIIDVTKDNVQTCLANVLASLTMLCNVYDIDISEMAENEFKEFEEAEEDDTKEVVAS